MFINWLNSKTCLVIFSLVFAVTLAFTLFSDKGLIHLISINHELHRLEKSNRHLSLSNNELFTKIKKLAGNRIEQEETIRKELGWVKNDEVVIEFFPSSRKSPGEIKDKTLRKTHPNKKTCTAKAK